MAAIDIFPFDPWQEGTNDNAVPANANALRIQAALAPARGFAGSAPSSPADGDQWIVSITWGSHSVGNVVLRVAGAWQEFAAYDGMLKTIDGAIYVRISGNWVAVQSWVSVPVSADSDGTAGQLAYDTTNLYICVATNAWKRITLATW